jgi:hypothetical protein
MTDAAIERLTRDLADPHRPGPIGGGFCLVSASDLRHALERVKALELALTPFAKIWDEKSKPYGHPPITPEVGDLDHAWGFNRADLFWGDFRKARAALNTGEV